MDMRIDEPSRDSEISLFLLKPSHVSEEYVSWLNNPVVNRYLETRFSNHTIESTNEFVEKMHSSDNNLLLGIRSKVLGRHVGNIKLGPIDMQHRTSEVGIMIGDTEAWGKGVATVAISMLSEIAKDRLSLRKLTAGCYVSNIGSLRAFEKAGFFIEGRREKQFLLDNEPEDIILMGKFLT